MLIIGSGNIVRNLREMAWEDTAYDWALEFDATMKDLILAGDHKAIVDYSKLGRSARLTVPTLDHYLPLLYVLGAQDKEDSVGFFADKVTLGSMFPTSQPRVGSVLPRLGARADRPPSLTDRISVIFDGQPASSSCWLSRSLRKSAGAVAISFWEWAPTGLTPIRVNLQHQQQWTLLHRCFALVFWFCDFAAPTS